MRRGEMRQRQRFLEQWRPTSARRVADLSAAGIDRSARPPRPPRQRRREATLGEGALQGVPLDFESDETPAPAARLLRAQGLAAVEWTFVVAHRPAKVQLIGR